MAILKSTKVWKLKRTLPPKTAMRPCELTPGEQENVRAAALKLRGEHGSWEALAAAMGVDRVTLLTAKTWEERRLRQGSRFARSAGKGDD